MPNDEQHENPYAPPKELTRAPGPMKPDGATGDGISINGLFSASDYQQGFRLFYGRRYLLRGMETAVLACAAIVTAHVSREIVSARLGPMWLTHALLLFGASFAGIAALGMRVLLQQRRWRKSISKLLPVRLDFSEEGIRTLTDDLDHLYRWQAFDYYRRNEQIMIFVLSNDIFVLAPRRFFAADAWERLTQLAGRKLMRK